MKKKRFNILGRALRNFLSDYLPNLRGMSPHTILSYRDSLKLLLQYLAEQKGVSASNLDIEDIGTEKIVAFLAHLETNRKNKIGTRNNRLSAIHSFFRFLGGAYPEYLDMCHRVLNIPFKRVSTRRVEYLEFNEIESILQCIDRSKIYGRRDYALISLMFNTGARVQEVVNLKGNDLNLTNPFGIKLRGKGKKERICPLWPQTAHILHDCVEEWGVDLNSPVTVFKNHLGKPLTRFGVRYILAKYLRLGADRQPSLKRKRLHPHSIRHSTAIHLLKSGVDLATISQWLGHCSLNTTNKYAKLDLEMKREAIARAKPLKTKRSGEEKWRKDPDILMWLESL